MKRGLDSASEVGLGGLQHRELQEAEQVALLELVLDA
jgi:hypothetical protein